MTDSIEPTAEHRLRYDEAVRAITDQFASLDAAQSRAGLLLATLAISAAELGTRAADRPGNPFPAAQVVAWLSLLVCAGALLFAIWPHKYRTTFQTEKLPRKPADHLVQDIAHSLATDQFPRIAKMIKAVWLAIQVGIVAMSVNVAAWVSIVIFR